jgi:hypothetical protein
MKKNQKKNFASGRWVHPTTHPDNAGLVVHGPTHTDQIGSIRCPKWVSPLEDALRSAVEMGQPAGDALRSAVGERISPSYPWSKTTILPCQLPVVSDRPKMPVKVTQPAIHQLLL